MNGCDYSIKIILAPLKERITETNFFENIHTATERSTQTMDDCKISRQNKYSFFQKTDLFHNPGTNGWLQLFRETSELNHSTRKNGWLKFVL